MTSTQCDNAVSGRLSHEALERHQLFAINCGLDGRVRETGGFDKDLALSVDVRIGDIDL